MPPGDATSSTTPDAGVAARASSASAQEKVLAALVARPFSFDFFQAVRLLMRISRRGAGEAAGSWRPVGYDFAPQNEIVRFTAHASHSFPPAEIAAFSRAAGDAASDERSPAEMTVAFLGLTGPAGALPQHYTQTIIDRLRLKDRTLRDFLDLFNHRTISLFYRAWEKYRVPPLMERALAENREDPFTRALYSLVGLGAPALRDRLEAPDETFLYYCGLFVHQPKNAISLERLVAELFALPAAVLQFQGQWLRLEPSEQTAMPSANRPAGLNNQLGRTAIAGEAVWSVESNFRLRLGPLRYDAFRELLPGSPRLIRLGQIVRTYVGPELDFNVQLVLRREEVPLCQLTPSAATGPRLGWNTWACSKVRATDATDAVFVSDGRPTR